jgi:ribosomal protein S18 acetylase RimI-like enzyme
MAWKENKLDNPVWYSLQETHKMFLVQMENISFYHPDLCSFGGFINEEHIANEIDKYAKLSSDFYVVGQKPKYNNSVRLNKELVCNQMILETPIHSGDDEEIVKLERENKDDLLYLVNLVQPGYFKKRTLELGSYFGIYNDAKLIAVTGERMKMDSYTEVSAVVTHSNHLKQGYAKKLVAYTTNRIFSENKIPYLHVQDNNAKAIHLYEKLGFKLRRKISFWNFGSING